MAKYLKNAHCFCENIFASNNILYFQWAFLSEKYLFSVKEKNFLKQILKPFLKMQNFT